MAVCRKNIGRNQRWPHVCEKCERNPLFPVRALNGSYSAGARMGRRGMKKLLLFSIILILNGCVYNGALEQKFYNTTQRDAKLPLSVNLVESKSLKTQKVSYAHMGGNPSTYNITLQPALTEAIKTALASVFIQVGVVEQTRSKDKVDILAIPEYHVKLLYRSGWTGVVVFETNFTLMLKEPHTLEEVATFTNSQRVVRTPGAVTHIMMVFTGLSFYILSPITLTIDSQVVGEHYVELFEDDIKDHLNIIIGRIESDPRIRKMEL